MDNKMAEVAKMLGVKLNEVFRIDGNRHYFRLTDTGLEVSVGMDLAELKHTAWFSEDSCMLSGLLTGELKIKKLPWQPAKYDSYYYPCLDYEDYENLWGRSTWTDTRYDKSRLKHGLVFKTKEEAVVLAQRMLAVAKEARENG